MAHLGLGLMTNRPKWQKASRVQRLHLEMLWHELELANSEHEDVALPSETHVKLGELVSSDALDRCRKMRYERVHRMAGNASLQFFGALHLCRCFAAREMPAELDTVAQKEKTVREEKKSKPSAAQRGPEQMFALDVYYKTLGRQFRKQRLGSAVIAALAIGVSWLVARPENAVGFTVVAVLFALIFPVLAFRTVIATYKQLYGHETV